MFQSLSHNNQIIGFQAEVEDSLFFFGTKHGSLSLLREVYPAFTFCGLKQVHGNLVVPASIESFPEADGHVSRVRHQALTVQTADCLPILLAGRDEVMALHAGWRGLVANIIGTGAALIPAIQHAAIGPHIRTKSFEVGLDVATQLSEASAGDVVEAHTNSQKRHVNLTKVARQQLASHFAQAKVIELPGDTFTSDLFHSFRRRQPANGDGSGRQYSFVVRV